MGLVILVEFGDVPGDFGGLLDGERLVIRKERAGAGDIRFGLLVRAAMNGVVRALEEQRLAIHHQLDAGIVDIPGPGR